MERKQAQGITVFNGGHNKVIAQHLLPKNMAENYVNVDHTRGTLCPIMKPIQIDNQSSVPNGFYKVYYDAAKQWIDIPKTYDNPEFVEFHDRLYYMDDLGNLVLREKDDDDVFYLSNTSDENSATTKGEELVLTAVESSTVSQPDVVATEFTGGEESYFTYTYRSTKLGIETPPAPPTRVTFDLPEGEEDSKKYNLVISNLNNIIQKRSRGFDRVSIYQLVANETEDGISGASYVRVFECKCTDNQDTFSISSFGTASNGISNVAFSIDAPINESSEATTQRTKRVERINETLIIEDNISDTSLATNDTNGSILYRWSETQPETYQPEGTVLTTIENGSAPQNLFALTENSARMFAIHSENNRPSGSRVHFSDVGSFHIWRPLSFIAVPENATALSKAFIRADENRNANGILVHSLNQTWILVQQNNDLSNPIFSLTNLSANQGCVSQRSVQSINGRAIWASKEGICVYVGGRVSLLTKKVIGLQSWDEETVKSSAVYNDTYYLLLNDGWVYVIDEDYEVQKWNNYGIEDLNELQVGDSMLVGQSDTMYDLEPKTGFEFLPMSYRSKSFVQDMFSTDKSQTEISISGRGNVELRVMVSGKQAFNSVVPLTEDPQTLKLSQINTRGSSIYFEITGEGEVYDILWPVTVQLGT